MPAHTGPRVHVGTVKWYSPDKGYGFIASKDEPKDHFVHRTALVAAGVDFLQEGQELEYQLETGKSGKDAAVNLKLL